MVPLLQTVHCTAAGSPADCSALAGPVPSVQLAGESGDVTTSQCSAALHRELGTVNTGARGHSQYTNTFPKHPHHLNTFNRYF